MMEKRNETEPQILCHIVDCGGIHKASFNISIHPHLSLQIAQRQTAIQHHTVD